MALPSLALSTLGPMSSGINFKAKMKRRPKFLFLRCQNVLGSGADLVRRTQSGNDLEHAWIMFAHVKRVARWTTTASHV